MPSFHLLCIIHLVFQGERKAELVGVFIEAGSVNGSTEVDLDTGAESLSVTIARRPVYTFSFSNTAISIYLRNTEDTRVGDLALDEGRAVKLELGTNLKSNSAVARGVPGSLTRGLKVAVDAVVVGSRVAVQVVESVDGNRVFSSRVAESSVVAVDLQSDVVSASIFLLANHLFHGMIPHSLYCTLPSRTL